MNQLNPFYERNFTCPICQMKFSSLSIRSSAIYVEKRESDFHCIYRGLNPLHYSIIVCPVCKYAASNNLFVKELPVAMVKQLSMALAHLPGCNIDFSKERDLDTCLESFKLAIRSSQLKRSGPGELAGLLLAAAWICREAHNVEQENSYLDEALKYYQQAFEKSSAHIGNLSDVQAAYLIGELYLRRGQFNEAINWFNRTIVHPNIKMNPAVEKQAREQWQVAREEANKHKAGDTFPGHNQSENIRLKIQNQNNNGATADELKQKKPAPAATVPRPRSTMQMMSNLYSDQIDWLNQIVNQGYDSSKSLVTKEQVLRSLLDACKELLDGEIPDKFSSEAELKARWLDMLKSK